MTDFEAWLVAGIRARHPDWFEDTQGSPVRMKEIARVLDFKSRAAGERTERKTRKEKL